MLRSEESTTNALKLIFQITATIRRRGIERLVEPPDAEALSGSDMMRGIVIRKGPKHFIYMLQEKLKACRHRFVATI
jgi:hypothetical protein